MHKSIMVKFKPVDSNKVYLVPSYETAGASGADLAALDDYQLPPETVTLISTNISVEIPMGYELQIRPRSGFSSKNNILVINSPGTIDADYRGEIKVALWNPDTYPKRLKRLQKYAQLVLCPVVQADYTLVEELSSTDRGCGGFGSTGNFISNPWSQDESFKKRWESDKADGVSVVDPYGGQGEPAAYYVCAKCFDFVPKVFPAACTHKPELEFGPIGMYHCPECGIMVLAGHVHPYLCSPCNLEIESSKGVKDENK